MRAYVCGCDKNYVSGSACPSRLSTGKSELNPEQDLDLAAQLRGVDVIVGGHSHSLLGDAADLLVAPHALPSDAYPIDPTQTRDKDGHKVP